MGSAINFSIECDEGASATADSQYDEDGYPNIPVQPRD
jgi:hypothetical protein